ncbi:response regulator [Caballeronia sp. GAFFF1]|uniref:response regulator transcription factor n=1 Tax=Caballeronia sp. GAFFF1 TaxID=2921779 RepID=UPI002028FD36|nr:response regulator [Caballeronia sp. GAFFF1]
MQVTLIDDDEAVRGSLASLLRAVGHAVSVFASAEAFLASDGVEVPDCLILDVNMPNMSGPDLFERMKGLGSTVPVLFITASKDDALRSRLLSVGAKGCLFKPFNDEALLCALQAAARGI